MSVLEAKADTCGLAFEPLEIAYQIADLIGVQPEFRHVWMAGDNALAECFFKGLNRVTFVKFSKWRGRLEWTCRDLVD
jgi:hypothetical protein